MIDAQTKLVRPKVIFMTGGFARSGYLMRKVKQQFGTQGFIVLSPYASQIDEYVTP